MEMKIKRPKFHPELPIGQKLEKGTAETFVWHLRQNNVDLTNAGENIRKTLARVDK